MKSLQLYLALLLLIGFSTLSAQSLRPHLPGHLRQSQKMDPCADMGPGFYEGPATTAHPSIPNDHLSMRSPAREVILGTSVYDLQSNSAVCKRISKAADGKIVGTWTMAKLADFSDRGTGYNSNDGTGWGPEPTTRLESVRTGWPNHVFTSNGNEFIVTHTGANRLHALRRPSTGGAWTETDIPTSTPNGTLWPRAAVGGANGQTIHVIAISTPVANGGVEYAGVNGHILYYRSQDGGVTWDITDGIIPGLDSTNYVRGSADAYYIDARGDVVVVGVFDGWNDLNLFKSDDNGNNWTRYTVLDFPLERYTIDQGYTVNDLPPYDASQPDSLAILSNDGTGTVLVDNNGLVHCFFGIMYVQDDDLTDGNSSYYPATDGLAYWNESYGDNNARVIAYAPDLNNNDTLDIAAISDIALYYTSLTSQPSAGVDADNNLFLAYSVVLEGDQYINVEDNQHYRHIYVTSSTDGGETWADAYDVINPDVMTEPDLVDFNEAVFPSVIRDVTDSLQLLFQYDYRPGLAVRGDMDPVEDNFISFVSLPIDLTGVVGVKEVVKPAALAVRTMPNPTSGNVTVSLELPTATNLNIEILNTTGQVLQQWSSKNVSAGQQQTELDLSRLESGMYLLRLQTDTQVTATKIIKR